MFCCVKIKYNGEKMDSFNKVDIIRRKIKISGEPLNGELLQAGMIWNFRIWPIRIGFAL